MRCPVSMHHVLPILVVLVVGAVPCAGQAAPAAYPEVLPGARVRITAPGVLAGRYVGTVLSRSADTVVVANSAGAQVRVPVTAMSSIEVSRGKSRMAGFTRGIAWGAPIGAGFGLLSMSAIDGTDQGDGETWGQGEWVAYSALSGAIWGGLIGAIVGRERWDAYSAQGRVSVMPGDGGVRMGLAFAR